MRQLGDDITRFEKELATIEVDYDALLLKVPNLTSPDTPIGPDGSGNKILRQVGKIPSFDFQPKEHWELGLALDVLDVERAAKVSGSRFGYLKGALAQMEFALVQFVLSIVTDEGTLNKIAKRPELEFQSKLSSRLFHQFSLNQLSSKKWAGLNRKKSGIIFRVMICI